MSPLNTHIVLAHSSCILVNYISTFEALFNVPIKDNMSRVVTFIINYFSSHGKSYNIVHCNSVDLNLEVHIMGFGNSILPALLGL